MTYTPSLADLQAQLDCVRRDLDRRARAYQQAHTHLSADASAAMILDLATMQAVARTLKALIADRQNQDHPA